MRFFFISFSFVSKDGTSGFGNTCTITNGHFLVKKLFTRDVLNEFNHIQEVVILNIVELTKQEYDEFNLES